MSSLKLLIISLFTILLLTVCANTARQVFESWKVKVFTAEAYRLLIDIRQVSFLKGTRITRTYFFPYEVIVMRGRVHMPLALVSGNISANYSCEIPAPVAPANGSSLTLSGLTVVELCSTLNGTVIVRTRG